jgi:hypothetical protein
VLVSSTVIVAPETCKPELSRVIPLKVALPAWEYKLGAVLEKRRISSRNKRIPDFFIIGVN